MRTNIGPFRQGDILIRLGVKPTQRAMSKLRRVAPKTNGGVIIAEGEATGHNHILKSDDSVVLEHREGEVDGRIIITSSGGELVHDEHETIELPALEDDEVLVVSRQREYQEPTPRAPKRTSWVYD